MLDKVQILDFVNFRVLHSRQIGSQSKASFNGESNEHESTQNDNGTNHPERIDIFGIFWKEKNGKWAGRKKTCFLLCSPKRLEAKTWEHLKFAKRILVWLLFKQNLSKEASKRENIEKYLYSDAILASHELWDDNHVL